MKGMRRGSITSDKNQLAIFIKQKFSNLKTVKFNSFWRFITIGHMRGITKVNYLLIWQYLPDCVCYRKASDTGIKNSNG
jgi:hypothetical protein